MSASKNIRKFYFAENLLYLMKRDGVTQPFLAEVIGTSQAAISRYLNGRVPHSPQLFAIANFFKVSIDELLQQNIRAREGLQVAGPVRRRLAYDALMEQLADLPDYECETISKVLLSVLKQMKKTRRA